MYALTNDDFWGEGGEVDDVPLENTPASFCKAIKADASLICLVKTQLLLSLFLLFSLIARKSDLFFDHVITSSTYLNTFTT